MTLVVDAVAECRLDRSMINEEGADLDAVHLVNDTLTNIARDDSNALGRKPLVHIPPNMDIERKRLLQMVDHRPRAIWSPHRQWRRSALRSPGKQNELRQGDDVV